MTNIVRSEDDLRQHVAAVYTAESRDYRELWAPQLHPVASGFVCGLPSSTDVLDLGTGVGTLLPTLRNRLGARHVVGLDVTQAMIALAEPSFGRVVGDAARLPFTATSFDVVVAAFVLFHLARPQDALREARRVLRPGGTLGTITWESDSGSRALEVWTAELDRFGAPELSPASCHDPVDRPEKIAALLEGQGFEHVRAWTLAVTDETGPDEFIQRRLRLGTSRRRLDSLDPDTRRACISDAIERIRRLPPHDFLAQWRFVLATARR